MVNRQKVLDCVAQSVLLLGRQDQKLARLMQLSKEVRNMEEEMVLLINALQGPVLGYTRARVDELYLTLNQMVTCEAERE
jgi:hypothetical protein